MKRKTQYSFFSAKRMAVCILLAAGPSIRSISSSGSSRAVPVAAGICRHNKATVNQRSRGLSAPAPR